MIFRSRYVVPMLAIAGIGAILLVYYLDHLGGGPGVPASAHAIGLMAAITAAVLLLLFEDTRRKFRRLNEQRQRLSELTDRMAQSLETLNEINAELRESEERYRGLVESHRGRRFHSIVRRSGSPVRRDVEAWLLDRRLPGGR